MSREAMVNKFFIGIFDDESRVVAAVKTLRERGVPIHDVYTPYAIHGLDDAMGIKRSRLPIVCFFAGVLGLLFAVLFQSWVFMSSWPLNFGGKPFFALPAFVPVSFEVTVLVGGLTTVAAFFIRSKLYPGACPVKMDDGITDDKFVVAIAKNDASLDEAKVGGLMLELGAVSVRECGVMS